jgi:hypothetical protein
VSAGPGSIGGKDRRFPFLPVALLSGIVGAFVTRWLTALPYGNPDSHAFEAIARSLLAGRGLVYEEPMLGGLSFFAYRSPGYPIFLAPLLAIGGIPLALTVQGALAGVTAALIGRLGERLGGARAAWCAWALALTWWPTWVFAGQLLSESLYVTLSVLVLTALLAALRASKGPRAVALAALAGVLTAAAALTRSPGAVVGVALVFGLLLLSPRLVVPYLVAAVLAWAPWPIRNAIKLGAFVPLTTNAAMNVFDGNSPVETAACWDEMAAHPERGELGFERYFAERTRREVLARPVELARGLIAKGVHYVIPSGRKPFAWMLRAVLLVAVVGLAGFASVRKAWFLPGLIYIAQWAVSTATVVGDRHRYPGEWLIVLATALTIAAWWGRRAEARSRSPIERPTG